MKISVIVPTYNREHILPLCLDSLVIQEYSKNDYEIIVVDNNSKDNTKDVVHQYIKKYPNVVIRYIFEPQAGLVFARHAGADNAKYDYLSFTDDDGILDPCWLKEIAHVFQLNSQIAAVAGKIIIRWDKTPPDWVIPYEPLLGKLDYGNDILIKEGLYINGGNFNIKKNVLYEAGGFNPDQVGEWLIGDGESGLCRKLHDNKLLIGWSPKAIMEHYQLVEKNATVEDIKRRFINNGRGIPYSIFALKKGGIKELLENLLIADEKIQRLEHRIKENDSIEKKYKIMFDIEYYSCQISYTYEILSNEELRNNIIKSNINDCEINSYFNLNINEQFKILFNEYISLQKKYNSMKIKYKENIFNRVKKKIKKILIK